MPRCRFIVMFAVLLSLAAGRAEAVSVRDVIELSKAGLSDPVLLALIDVDHSVFSLDPATLKQLKAEGVSDAVIVAMIHSGRDTPPPPPAPLAQEPSPQPDVPQVSEEPAPPAPAPVAYPVPIFVPYYVAVPVAGAHRSGRRVTPPAAAAKDALPNCQSAQVPQWGFGGTVYHAPAPCR